MENQFSNQPVAAAGRLADLAVPVTLADHSAGHVLAPITLVEYGDYECPGCLNAEPIVSWLKIRYSDRLRVVFRHFPQNSVHPKASVAALAAEAAAIQGKFWEMHRQLFRHQRELADLDFTHLALLLNLEIYRFERDMDAAAGERKVRLDYDGGVASGVRGTPTFFINGRRYTGPVTEATLAAAIEAA